MEQKAVDYSYRCIWLMAYPILISLIMEQMIGITDTAFLGRVGEVELGASAIAGVYYLAIFMIGFGFTVGSQILMARRNGEGNYKAIGGIFYQGIYFLLLMSAVIFTDCSSLPTRLPEQPPAISTGGCTAFSSLSSAPCSVHSS